MAPALPCKILFSLICAPCTLPCSGCRCRGNNDREVAAREVQESEPPVVELGLERAAEGALEGVASAADRGALG